MPGTERDTSGMWEGHRVPRSSPKARSKDAPVSPVHAGAAGWQGRGCIGNVGGAPGFATFSCPKESRNPVLLRFLSHQVHRVASGRGRHRSIEKSTSLRPAATFRRGRGCRPVPERPTYEAFGKGLDNV